MLRLAGTAARRLARGETQSLRFLSASPSPSNKEPIEDSLAGVSGIAGRYATALFSAGKKAGQLDGIDKDLAQLTAIAAESPAFAAFLKDRSVAKGTKAKQLAGLLADAKVGDVTKNFFAVLTENGRLAELPRVVDAFGALLAASKGQVTATVTTADPLSREEEEEVRKGLADALPKGRTLKLVTRTDPAIIGGLVVDIGDKHIDLSIASRVKQVQQLLASGTAE